MVNDKKQGFIRNMKSWNLFFIVLFIIIAFEFHSQVDVIYNDISIAFDKVDNTIVMRKSECSIFINGCSLIIKYIKVIVFSKIATLAMLPKAIQDTAMISAKTIYFNNINDIGNKLGVDKLLYADDLKLVNTTAV